MLHRGGVFVPAAVPWLRLGRAASLPAGLPAEEAMVPPDPGIRSYVRNKRPADTGLR